MVVGDGGALLGEGWWSQARLHWLTEEVFSHVAPAHVLQPPDQPPMRAPRRQPSPSSLLLAAFAGSCAVSFALRAQRAAGTSLEASSAARTCRLDGHLGQRNDEWRHLDKPFSTRHLRPPHTDALAPQHVGPWATGEERKRGGVTALSGIAEAGERVGALLRI